MIYDIVRKLPDGAQILLEGDGDRSVMAIRAGRSRFTLQTLPESDFPDLAASDMTHSFTLPAADLKRLIDEIGARPAAQRAVALKDRHTFKAEMDDAARRIMFPHNARLAGQGAAPA